MPRKTVDLPVEQAKLSPACEDLIQHCQDHGLTDDALSSEIEEIFVTTAATVNLAGIREQVATMFTCLGPEQAKENIDCIIADLGEPDDLDEAADPSDLDRPFLDELEGIDEEDKEDGE